MIARGNRSDRAPVALYMFRYPLPVEADHSQYSLPIEAINLTIESKSSPIEVDKSEL